MPLGKRRATPTGRLRAMLLGNRPVMPPRQTTYNATSPVHLAKTKKRPDIIQSLCEAPPGIGPGNEDFADPCLTAWLCRHVHYAKSI